MALTGNHITDQLTKPPQTSLNVLKVRLLDVSTTRDLPQAPSNSTTRLPPVQQNVIYHDLQLLRESQKSEALHVCHDLELAIAIQDLEDRAGRLRDLIEPEEIVTDECRRLSEESRRRLLGACDQLSGRVLG